MSTADTIRFTGLDLPARAALARLCIGGAAGLFLWELWARILTKAVLGYPLEPAGLIDAIANHLFALQVPYLLRETLHYLIGIVGYPVAYFLISRNLPRWGLVLDAVVLVTFTAAYGAKVAAGTATPVMFIFYTAVVALVVSRNWNRSAFLADMISWGNFTWFNALGLFAPVFGGLSFYLLGEGGELSYMSFVGHVIYGAVAAAVFERLEAARR